jgi:hypothetical protein
MAKRRSTIGRQKANPSKVCMEPFIYLFSFCKCYECFFFFSLSQWIDGDYVWRNETTTATWKVNLTLCPKREFQRVGLTLWDILNGNFVYYLPGTKFYIYVTIINVIADD